MYDHYGPWPPYKYPHTHYRKNDPLKAIGRLQTAIRNLERYVKWLTKITNKDTERLTNALMTLVTKMKLHVEQLTAQIKAKFVADEAWDVAIWNAITDIERLLKIILDENTGLIRCIEDTLKGHKDRLDGHDQDIRDINQQITNILNQITLIWEAINNGGGGGGDWDEARIKLIEDRLDALERFLTGSYTVLTVGTDFSFAPLSGFALSEEDLEVGVIESPTAYTVRLTTGLLKHNFIGRENTFRFNHGATSGNDYVLSQIMSLRFLGSYSEVNTANDISSNRNANTRIWNILPTSSRASWPVLFNMTKDATLFPFIFSAVSIEDGYNDQYYNNYTDSGGFTMTYGNFQYDFTLLK